LAPDIVRKSLKPIYRAIAETVKPPYQIEHLTRPVEHQTTYRDKLVVMSANLWHDWPRFRRLEARLDAFSEMALDKQADILLLQEVASTSHLDSLERLAENLQMGYVYTRANGNTRIGFEEGLAIFSRYPIVHPVLRRLGGPAAGLEHRMALGAQVLTPQGRLMAFSAHLGLTPAQNERQLADLKEWVHSSVAGRAAIVGGDFNAPENTRQIRAIAQDWVDTFRASKPLDEAHTHTLHWPWGAVLRRARLDYLFLIPGTPGWRVADADHTTTPRQPHSDHCAVIAHLQPA
jgi:endonuclease/exonuclease/phosphatase family metal-dependent hydrolase